MVGQQRVTESAVRRPIEVAVLERIDHRLLDGFRDSVRIFIVVQLDDRCLRISEGRLLTALARCSTSSALLSKKPFNRAGITQRSSQTAHKTSTRNLESHDCPPQAKCNADLIPNAAV